MKQKQKILVIDDEPDILELLQYKLKSVGYGVLSEASGEQGLKTARTVMPDLIVLDVMLPGMSGLEICKALRRDNATARLPILMLSAKADEIDRVLGLEIGADDYLTKPFNSRELMLRVHKLLQPPAPSPDPDEIKYKDLVISRAKHAVTYCGKRIALTRTEFNLLATLAARRGRPQSRETLMRDICEYDRAEFIDSRTIDAHMARLRQKLGEAAKYLETKRGVGWMFAESGR